MIKKLINPESAWESSTFSDIPVLPDAKNEVVRHFCVVAGGLALILSRNRNTAIEVHYAQAAHLYDLLSQQLKKYGKTSASAELLNNVMHEVAEVADPLTMTSLRKCLDLRRQHDAKRRQNSVDSTVPPRLRMGLVAQATRDANLLKSPELDSGILSLMGPESADEGQMAAQRLKDALDQARRRRELAMPRGSMRDQPNSEGNAASSL